MIIDSNMKGASMIEVDPHAERPNAKSLKASSMMPDDTDFQSFFTEVNYPSPNDVDSEAEGHYFTTGDGDHSPKLVSFQKLNDEIEASESDLSNLDSGTRLNSMDSSTMGARPHNGPSILVVQSEDNANEIEDNQFKLMDANYPENSRPFDLPVPTSFATKVNMFPGISRPTSLPFSHPSSGLVGQNGDGGAMEWDNEMNAIPVGIYSEKCPVYVVTKTIVVTQDMPRPTYHDHPNAMGTQTPMHVSHMHPRPHRNPNEHEVEEEDDDDRIDSKNTSSERTSEPIIVVVENTSQGPTIVPLMPPMMMGPEEIEWSSYFALDDAQSDPQSLSAASSPSLPTLQPQPQSQPQSFPLSQAQPSNPLPTLAPAPASVPSQPQALSTQPNSNTISTSPLAALYNAYLQTNQQIIESGLQVQQQQEREQVQQQQAQLTTQQQQQQLQAQQMQSTLSMYQPINYSLDQSRSADTQSAPSGQLLVASGTESINYPMWTPSANQNPNYSTY